MCSLKLIVFCCHQNLVLTIVWFGHFLTPSLIKDHNISAILQGSILDLNGKLVFPGMMVGVCGFWSVVIQFTNEQKRLCYFHLTKQKRDRCTAVCTTSTIVPAALWVALKGSRWVAMATFQYGWPVPFPIAVIISVISGRPWRAAWAVPDVEPAEGRIVPTFPFRLLPRILPSPPCPHPCSPLPTPPCAVVAGVIIWRRGKGWIYKKIEKQR